MHKKSDRVCVKAFSTLQYNGLLRIQFKEQVVLTTEHDATKLMKN